MAIDNAKGYLLAVEVLLSDKLMMPEAQVIV